MCLWHQRCSPLFFHISICMSLYCILYSMPAQEVLPLGMHVHSIGSGHAKLTFKGYYTAVLTLAEAPEAQADPPCQPGAPQQGVPSQGHLQQQPGHPQQQQPGPAEPMDVDQQADEVTSSGMRAVSQDEKVGPHKEKYRWRLLSFDILPGTITGPADTLVQSYQLHPDFPKPPASIHRFKQPQHNTDQPTGKPITLHLQAVFQSMPKAVVFSFLAIDHLI